MPQADTSTLTGYSVADLCRRWRIGADKIRAFLRRVELVGINVATHLSGRQLLRVTPESVQQFEQRRSSVQTPKPVRRRKQAHLIDYYLDHAQEVRT